MATQITLEVFHWSRERGSPLPSTVTELYKSYTVQLIQQYLSSRPLLGVKAWKSSNFSDLPQPINQYFHDGLSRLAFEGLFDGLRLVFPEVPKPLQVETLGLIQLQAPLYGRDDSECQEKDTSLKRIEETSCPSAPKLPPEFPPPGPSTDRPHQRSGIPSPGMVRKENEDSDTPLTEVTDLSFSSVSQPPLPSHTDRAVTDGALSTQTKTNSPPDLPPHPNTLSEFSGATGKSSVPTYHFNHLTLQEFLAAYWISTLPQEEISKMVRELSKDGHFKMTLRFLAGLKGLSVFPGDITEEMLTEDKLSLFHWLFEAGEGATADILGSGEMKVESHYSWNPADYYVTASALVHSNCAWDLDFSSSAMDDEKMELFVRGLCTSDESKRGNGHIRSLDLSNNDLTSRGAGTLKDIPAHVVHNLHHLDLSVNKLDGAGADAVAIAIPSMPNLQTLNLGGNRGIGGGGAVSLLSALSECRHLKLLNLRNTGIAEEDCEQLAKLLTLSESLETLSYDNSLSSQSVGIVLSGLRQNKSLKKLDMGGSQFSHENMSELGKYLQDSQCTLETLDLFGSHISTVSAMAQALTHNSSVKELVLSYNPVADQGAVQLAAMLEQHPQTIVELDLRSCGISTVGGVRLAAALQQNTVMEKLYISDNAIGVDGAKAFATMLTHNTTLKTLWLYGDDSLEEEGVRHLCESMKLNKTMEELRLPEKYKHETGD